jgi:hypothetical protein
MFRAAGPGADCTRQNALRRRADRQALKSTITIDYLPMEVLVPLGIASHNPAMELK